MLRVIVSPALHTPIYSARLATRLPLVARGFSSVAPRLRPLVSRAADQPGTIGSEGSHRSEFYFSLYVIDSVINVPMYVPEDAAPQRNDSLTTDPIDTAPTHIVKGDWVLFHPVYSTSELRAVKVGVNLILTPFHDWVLTA